MNRQNIFGAIMAGLILSTSLLAQDTDECAVPRTDLSRDALMSCFGTEIAADQDILAVVAPIWQSFDDAQKEHAIDRYSNGMPADASIVADTYPRTAGMMRILHTEAITIGEQEFLSNIQRDPKLEGLTDEDFIAYRDEILDAFLDGTDNSTLSEFVTYAPSFTEYVLTFSADFVFAEDLQRVVNISELRASIAEQNAIQAEQNAIQAEQNAIQAEHNAIQAEHNAIQAEQNAIQAEHNARQAALDRLQRALQGDFD